MIRFETIQGPGRPRHHLGHRDCHAPRGDRGYAMGAPGPEGPGTTDSRDQEWHTTPDAVVNRGAESPRGFTEARGRKRLVLVQSRQRDTSLELRIWVRRVRRPDDFFTIKKLLLVRPSSAQHHARSFHL